MYMYLYMHIQIQDAKDISVLQEVLMNNIDLFIKCGYCRPIIRVTMSKKVDIIQSVALQEVLLNSLAELTQFKEGMKDLGVLDMIQEHKDLLRSFYCTQRHNWMLVCLTILHV